MKSRTGSLLRLAVYASVVLGGAVTAAHGTCTYDHGFQFTVGDRATFHVDGPATGGSPDVEGDAWLRSVEFPSGDRFQLFYKPVAVTNVQFTGDPQDWRVRAGTNTTSGLSGDSVYGEADGNPADVSPQDTAAFRGLMLQALRTNNLNQYVDCSSDAIRFRFTVKFDRVVRDNDAGADDFGEILYFERGTGDGNSWLRMRAVDAAGTALGPWLVVNPNETTQTTPQTTVMRSDQKMGTSSIDVSRLGVTEFQYLELSNDCPGEPAYCGGGDLSPDFKIMAVMTNAGQIQQAMGIFD